MTALHVNGNRLAGAALLLILCALQLLCLWRAPAVFSPAAVSVALKAGQAVVLGRHELAAPQAADTHLGVRRDSAGRWWVRNVSAGKQVILRRDGVERRMGSSALSQGQSFRIGSARFEVTDADGRQIVFSGAGQEWRYDGATLLRNGGAQPPCPGAGIGARALALWNRALPHALDAARALSFGGNLHCGNRLGIPHLPGGSAVVARAGSALLLSNAGRPSADRHLRKAPS